MLKKKCSGSINVEHASKPPLSSNYMLLPVALSISHAKLLNVPKAVERQEAV